MFAECMVMGARLAYIRLQFNGHTFCLLANGFDEPSQSSRLVVVVVVMVGAQGHQYVREGNSVTTQHHLLTRPHAVSVS